MNNKLNLYAHNLNGYNKVKAAYDSGQRVVGIVHATGTGKSYIFLQLCLDNPNLKTLFVAPSNAIIEHILETIKECGLSLEKDFPNLKFCTYQSLINMSYTELEKLDVDMLCLDEFHHIGAPIWGDKINTIVNTHPNMKVFGMTAYTIRDRGTKYVRDMALPGGNELFSDKIVSTYDLIDAMIDGVLPIPNYKSAYLRLNDELLELEQQLLNENIEDNEEYLSIIKSCKHQLDKALTAKDLIKDNLKFNDKCIYFCPLGDGEIIDGDIILGTNNIFDIRDRVLKLAMEVNKYTVAFETTSELDEYGKLSREHFYNDTDFWNNDISNVLRIMFAKNQYNEGVHAPGVTKVFLARETKSDIVYFEQIGRALSVKGNIIELTKEYEEKNIDELKIIANEQGIDISKCESKEQIIERLLAPTIIDLAGNIEFIKELKDNLLARIKEREEKGIPTKITRKLVEASFDIDVKNEDIFRILQDIKNKRNISSEILIEEYIEMLVDDRIKEIKSKDSITFIINGQFVVRKHFWNANSQKIKEKLKEEKYQDSKYDKVREKIRQYEEKNNKEITVDMLIEEYIEMLADDRISEIKSVDSITFIINGQEIIRINFWSNNSKKIKEKLKEEKYKDSKYDKARAKIKGYEEKNNKDITSKMIIEEYIKMLADDRIKEIKSMDSVAFIINGQPITRTTFWNKNSQKIKEKLKEDKYKDSKYDKVREKIRQYEEKNNKEITNDMLIEEYIEMLADDRIKEIKSNDSVKFIINGQPIIKTQFWSVNSNKIKEKLKEDKYKDSKYDKARVKIKQYEEKNNKDITSEMIIEEYIKMLADGRISVIKSGDIVTFEINGQQITRKNFWCNANNSTKVKEKLKEEKYKDSRYDIVRLKIERVSNLRKNKEDIEQLCNKYNINYKKNKKYIDKIPYKIFETILTYFIDKNISYIDDNGMLVSDFYMSNIDFENKYGIGYIELINNKGKRL